jgi:hypothetical protein
MVLDSVASRNDEFNDFERHDLLTGEPRYVEDEIRNTQFAKIFGLLGLLFAIVSLVMVWVLYTRERSRTFLWHGIWMGVIAIFLLIAIAWGFMASTAVKSGRQPSPIFSGLIFILAIAYIGYLLVESVWLILYRKIHFDYLVGLSTDQDAWENRTPSGYTFEELWRQHRRMIWWIVFFNLATAFMLGFIAYFARSVSWNRYSLARATLYVALAVMALGGWLMIYWVEEAYEYRKAVPGYFLNNLLEVTKAWGIIALALAGANALVNFFQNKIGYFIMALLNIGLIVAMVLTAGVLLRDVRRAEFDGFFPGGCSATQYSIHENALSDRWCAVGGKYLPAGQTCRKVDLVARWEGSNEIRSLNPGCCSSSNFYYIYPFMLVGFWTLVTIFSAAIATGNDLYIADTNEYLTATNRTKGIIDFLGLGAVLGMIIAWGIYFIVRNANSLDYAPNPNFAAYNDPLNNRIAGFDLVPDAIKVNLNNTNSLLQNDGCISFNNSGSAYPTFNTAAACNDRTNCATRVALLFRDATVSFPNNGGAAQGSTTNREQFFPGCTSNLNDYVFYYGTEQQIRTLLENLRICPRATGAAGTSFFMYADQVPRANLQPNGVLNTEPAVPNIITNVDAATCGNGFTTANTCLGSCSLARTINQFSDTAPLKGRLYYIQNGARNFNIHSQVAVSAFNRNDPIGGVSTLYAGGIFTILNIPRYSSNNYVTTLNINDAVGVFLQKKVDILVPLAGAGTPEISAGFIRLDTKDGNICAPTDTACLANQRLQFGTIQGSVRDGTGEFASASSPVLNGASVQLIRWHQIAGQSLGNQTTSNSGAFTFSNIPYDSYSVIVNRTGFRPVLTFIDLQQGTLNIAPIILRPLIDNWDMRVTAQINEPSVDFDLNMLVRSDRGTECTVSPTNKYCAYSAHVNDVALGAGEENVLVKKLAVATYMPYLAPSPAYAANCPAGNAASANALLFHAQGWDWVTFKQTRPLSALDINTATIGPGVGYDPSSFNSLLGLLRFEESVETDAEAQGQKRVLNRNGVPVTGDIFENTYFGNGTRPTPPINNIPAINGTVTGNTTINFTANGCSGNVTTVQYTNNTAQGFINLTRTLNSTVCQNGTNFTEVNTTASFFGFDRSRGQILNRTFTTAYSNGTSRVEHNNTNFTYPNESFDFIRNQSNTSIITGVNTNVTSPIPFPINVTNTNHTYNESILQTFNPPSSNLTNDTTSTIVETNYNNGTLTQNFSRNANFFFFPIVVNASGNGTQNTTSFQVYDFGNLTLREACNVSLLSNGSTRLQCNTSNFTAFANGTNSTSNGTKDNLVTPNVNLGANIERLTFNQANVSNSSDVFFNRTENNTKIQLPNGTNSSLSVINQSQNLNDTVTRLYNYDWDVNDLNNTNTTVLNYSDYRNVTNGTYSLVTLFFNRTTTLNGSNFTLRNFSNDTINGTNQSNSSYFESSLHNVSNASNATNQSIFVSNWSFNVSANYGVANFSISNFTNETDFNVGTFVRFTRNQSNHSYPNGTNSSYFVQTNISNVSSVSNLSNGSNVSNVSSAPNTSIGNLSIVFNYSNNSSSTYNHSFNQTVTGNNSSIPNATITWNNETRIIVNVSGQNESFSNVSLNVSQVVPVNNTNSSLIFYNNFSKNLSQNLSYDNNTTIKISKNVSYLKASHNQSAFNDSNVTSWNYSLNTTGGDNISWSLLNASNLSTEGRDNFTLWIQRNWSNFNASNDSSVNKTNSTVYNYSNLSSFNNGSIINTTNLTINLSIGSNSSNATRINSTVYWSNRTYPNGSNFTTFIEIRNLSSPASTNWSNISFFNYSNFSVHAPNTTNVTQNVSSTNSCLAINSTLVHANNCNFSYNFTNGTNDTNASIINNTLDVNSTNYSNGSNYSYFFNVSNRSILNGTEPRVNITYFLLNESFVHPNISNGSNFTNFSRFIECYIEQNSTGFYSNCSNDSIAILGQNTSSLINSTNSSESNITIILANLTNTTNYSLNLLLLNTSNGSISDNISLYSNLTEPITINGTQINLTNVSNYSRNFSQNTSEFMFAFNESNYSKNVGVSLENSSHVILDSKNVSNTTFLNGNDSNSTFNQTVVNNWTNFTFDYRYNTANKSFVNNYSHNYSETYTPNSTANHSNISRNYAASVNSSLFHNVTFELLNASNNTGYNSSAIFHSNRTYGNITHRRFYPNTSSNGSHVYLNNSSLVQNLTYYVINASSGDAANFTANSTLGIDGVNFTIRNWSLNESQAVTNNSSIVAFDSLNWTLNNLTGVYRNGSGNLSRRNYTYRLFNLTRHINFTDGSPGLAVERTYDFFLYDSNNVSGGVNTTLNESHYLFNSTDIPSLNLTNDHYDLLVCQPNGTCFKTFYDNYTVNDSSPNSSNLTYSRNYTALYQNNTSNTTEFNQSLASTNISLNRNESLTNISSNFTFDNGSNFSQFNWTINVNSTNTTHRREVYNTSDHLLFLSPRDVDGNATGLIRNYTNNTSKLNITHLATNATTTLNYSNLTIDDIELPGGVLSTYYNSSNRTYVNNSTEYWNGEQQINRSTYNPVPPIGTPLSDYNNSTITVTLFNNDSVLFETLTANLSGFVAAPDDDSFGYRRCTFNTTANSTYFTNDSNATWLTATSRCKMLNNSVELNTTEKFVIVNHVTTNPTVHGNQNFTRFVDGDLTDNTTTAAHDVRRRRMLLQDHAIGNVNTNANTMAAHAQGSGNFIFISCFTGFGTASLIAINQIVDLQPSIDTCLTRLNAERPLYTVNRLRTAYNDYFAQNPNAPI